jgi:glycosyltransferase involved in cell wall biosynthesis
MKIMNKPLENVEVILLGAGINEKLSGGARIGKLLEILQRNGAKVTLISNIPYSDKFLLEKIQENNTIFLTISFPSKWPRFFKGIILLSFNFFFTLKYSKKSKIIWTSMGATLTNMPAVLAAKVRNRAMIYDFLDLEVEVPEFLVKFVIRQATVVFACSYFLSDRARNLYGCKNVIYVPCFVNMKDFQFNHTLRKKMRKKWNIKEDDIIIGYAGLLGTHEGPDILLHAVKRLLPTHRNLRVAIMGVVIKTHADGWVDIPSIIKKLNLENTVIMVPPVIHKEVPNFLSACDILVAPKLSTTSNIATIPIKLVEYLSMGLPTVTTSFGEVAGRIVKNKVNGYLAVPGDIQSLANVLEDVISNPKQAKNIGEIGRKSISKEFSDKAIAKTVVNAIKNITQ